MSNYPSKWLDCRYPFDADARNQDLVQRVIRLIQEKKQPHLLDLGAGNGSNYKFFQKYLPESTKWTAIEHDPQLASLLTNLSEDQITVRRESIFDSPLEQLSSNVDIVMANALFDLFSPSQFEYVAQPFIQKKVPLYFAINYTDSIFYPKDPLDEQICHLYHSHMQRKQPFGRAMGNQGPHLMEDYLKNKGELLVAKSNWDVKASDLEMLEYLLGFMETSINELNLNTEDKGAINEWISKRHSQKIKGELSMKITHKDILLSY